MAQNYFNMTKSFQRIRRKAVKKLNKERKRVKDEVIIKAFSAKD